MSKLVRTLTACLALALAVVLVALLVALRADTAPAAPAKLVLTGRSDQGSPFVTQLDNGRVTWFDTTLLAQCADASWIWNWQANPGTQRFDWTGNRLTAHHADQDVELDLQAGYTSAGGLKGRMRLVMHGCDSGWISFWATANR